MGCQDDYVMRAISDLIRAVARLVLDKNDIDYNLPEGEDRYTDFDRVYKRLKDLVDEGNADDAENPPTDELDTGGLDYLGMTLTLCIYFSQLKNDKLYIANYSREETVDGINSVYAKYDISEFKRFVNTTIV